MNLTLHHSLIIGVPIKGNNSWRMSFKSFQHWRKLSLYKISMHGECYKLTEELSQENNHIKPIYMEKVHKKCYTYTSKSKVTKFIYKPNLNICTSIF